MESNKTIEHRWTAFLRAVNVGGRRVTNDQLNQIFGDCGFANVRTFLASGNVTFDHAGKETVGELRRRVETRMAERLGFPVEIFLRSLANVRDISSSNPFRLTESEDGEFTVSVGFIHSVPDAGMKRNLGTLRTDYDDLAFGEREIYWLCRGNRISDSQLFKDNKLVKIIGVSCTFRNMNTLRRLVAREL